MDQSAQPPAAPSVAPAVPSSAPDSPSVAPGFRINEDWAATAVGLILILLVLAGVIVKGMVP